MNSGVIDNFLGVFTQYIDSGFGLLGPEVNFLARTLVLIDIILAALFWSWAGDEDIIARLIKKTLFVGVFAYLIGNWQMLSKAVFESFAALGLKASGTGLSEASFLQPGRVAQVGLDAGQPILQSISGLMGFVSFFENFIQITVLLFAWAIVLISFFVLAIQLFVSLIEFKLSTLCGFVLIPFGLFGKTLRCRARARQRHLLRRQGAGARRHRRHRLDAVLNLHDQLPGHAYDLRRDGSRPRLAVAARPGHLRPWYRQRHRLWRPSARRRRRNRYWPCGGRRRGGCRGRRRLGGRCRRHGRRGAGRHGPRRCVARRRHGRRVPGGRRRRGGPERRAAEVSAVSPGPARTRPWSARFAAPSTTSAAASPPAPAPASRQPAAAWRAGPPTTWRQRLSTPAQMVLPPGRGECSVAKPSIAASPLPRTPSSPATAAVPEPRSIISEPRE